MWLNIGRQRLRLASALARGFGMTGAKGLPPEYYDAASPLEEQVGIGHAQGEVDRTIAAAMASVMSGRLMPGG